MTAPTLCLHCGELEVVISHAAYPRRHRPFTITRYRCRGCQRQREDLTYLTEQGST